MKITVKRSKGNRVYEVTGYLGKYQDLNGITHTKCFHQSGFESSKLARIAFERAKAHFEKHYADATMIEEHPTFDSVYHIWLETYRLGVKESTLNRVLGIFKHHITPSLGSLPIDEINWQQCQQAALTWRKQVKQFNKLVQYAGLVFRTAQRMGVIDTNPMKLVDIPKLPATTLKPRNFWTAGELTTFLKAVDMTDSMPQHERYDRVAFFYLLATTGMRKGEAIALTWNDLDFERGTVKIDKTISRTIDNHQTVSTPKTANAYRTLKLDALTISRLKAYRQHFKVIPSASSAVFRNRKGNRLSLMTPNHWLSTFIEQTGLPTINVHGLRHTFASIQVANNINVKALQMQLGHSDIKITLNIYAHLSQEELSAKVFDVGNILAL